MVAILTKYLPIAKAFENLKIGFVFWLKLAALELGRLGWRLVLRCDPRFGHRPQVALHFLEGTHHMRAKLASIAAEMPLTVARRMGAFLSSCLKG
jgi:hypothetical protein